jgi:hypothetical protein
MTTEGAGDATTTMMIATTVGRRTTGVHVPLVRTSRTRGSPCVFELRPTYPGTTGTPTPAYGSRTTGSHVT